MHADQSQHRSPKGLVAREDYKPIISRAASLFKYERGLQMGKIIQFPGKREEDLYREYYLAEPELQRFYLRETVALNLTGGYQTGFYELSKKIPKDVLNKLLGSCAAYWADKEQFFVPYMLELEDTRRKYKVGVRCAE